MIVAGREDTRVEKSGEWSDELSIFKAEKTPKKINIKI
jgi:hypothetical protein